MKTNNLNQRKNLLKLLAINSSENLKAQDRTTSTKYSKRRRRRGDVQPGRPNAFTILSFIHPNTAMVLSQQTMYALAEDGEGVKEAARAGLCHGNHVSTRVSYYSPRTILSPNFTDRPRRKPVSELVENVSIAIRVARMALEHPILARRIRNPRA